MDAADEEEEEDEKPRGRSGVGDVEGTPVKFKRRHHTGVKSPREKGLNLRTGRVERNFVYPVG